MIVGLQRELASRLQAFVVASYTDAAFKRTLEYCPEDALAGHGLRWEEPGPLPILPLITSLRFDSATLFGVVTSSNGRRRIADEGSEVKLCLARCKPLLLSHAPEAEAARMVRQLDEWGLAALLSPYQFSPEAEQVKNGYSNSMSALEPARPGSGAWRTIIGGFEPERVMLAWLCLLFGWHELLGRLLGYPDCCCKAFPHRWVEALIDGSADPAKLILEECCSRGFAGTFGWETNVFARYFDHEAIQHFPCRLDCPRTVELARRNFAARTVFDAESAALTRRYLQYPVLFAGKKGVAVFPNAELYSDDRGARLKFDVAQILVASGAVDLKNALYQCGGQFSTMGSFVQVAGQRFEGWLLGFE